MKRKERRAQKLYGELSWLWPILSPPEDYVEEATVFAKAIRRHARRDVRTLLDLGCGGGHNDMTLKRHFKVTGVDVSEGMLILARKLNPEVRYIRGDMRVVKLRGKFDAVAIFDSINYMLSEGDLRRAFRTAYNQLNPGGVFLTYLEETKESFTEGKTHITNRNGGGVELTFIEYLHDPDPRDTTYESTMVFLIHKSDDLDVHIDKHELGLFRTDDVKRIMEGCGFHVKMSKFKITGEPGCPMLVGVKPI